MGRAANIHRVAEDMVREYGGDAYVYLRDQAHTAKLYGNHESAMRWWKIALAALEILKEQRAS